MLQAEKPRVKSKLEMLSSRLDRLTPEINRAVKDFSSQCEQLEILPHQSKVHTFEDAIAQTYLLAISARTGDQAYQN